jgi:hypothetical protein
MSYSMYTWCNSKNSIWSIFLANFACLLYHTLISGDRHAIPLAWHSKKLQLQLQLQCISCYLTIHSPSFKQIIDNLWWHTLFKMGVVLVFHLQQETWRHSNFLSSQQQQAPMFVSIPTSLLMMTCTTPSNIPLLLLLATLLYITIFTQHPPSLSAIIPKSDCHQSIPPPPILMPFWQRAGWQKSTQ